MPYAPWLSKWHFCNTSGIVQGVKTKLLENVEGGVEGNQDTTMCILVVKSDNFQNMFRGCPSRSKCISIVKRVHLQYLRNS